MRPHLALLLLDLQLEVGNLNCLLVYQFIQYILEFQAAENNARQDHALERPHRLPC